MNHDWKLVGIFESGKLARVCVKLQVLQTLTGNPGHLSQIFIKVDDPKNAQAIVDALRVKYHGYQIYTMEEFTSMLSISNVGMLKSFIGVVIGVAVVVGFIVVFMAMYTAVLERTRVPTATRRQGFRRNHTDTGRGSLKMSWTDIL